MYFKVGQIWKDGKGHRWTLTEVINSTSSPVLPIAALSTNNYLRYYTSEGKYYLHKNSKYDLVTLVKDVDTLEQKEKEMIDLKKEYVTVSGEPVVLSEIYFDMYHGQMEEIILGRKKNSKGYWVPMQWMRDDGWVKGNKHPCSSDLVEKKKEFTVYVVEYLTKGDNLQFGLPFYDLKRYTPTPSTRLHKIVLNDLTVAHI